MDFLVGELTGKRPLLPPNVEMPKEIANVINTFKVISELPPDSLGAYVISMAQSASDVLAVVLLQVGTSALHLALQLPDPMRFWREQAAGKLHMFPSEPCLLEPASLCHLQGQGCF